jgi:hypothetical protein
VSTEFISSASHVKVTYKMHLFLVLFPFPFGSNEAQTFLFWAVFGFELRALCLRGTYTATEPNPQLFLISVLITFPQAGLDHYQPA